MEDPRPFANPNKPLTAPPSNSEEARHVEALRCLSGVTLGYNLSISRVEEAVYKRLAATERVIEEIRRQFRGTHISVGVLHQGQGAYTKGFGFTSGVPEHPQDSNFVYKTGCLTQPLTAMAVSLLEQAGEVSWKLPVSGCVPNFHTQHGPRYDDQATLQDLLSHRTGLASVPFAIRGKHGAVIANIGDVQPIFHNLPPVAKPRSKWNHNEWGYALASQIIDSQSMNTWEDCVDNIIGKLGYPRTYRRHIVDHKWARPYYVMDDGTPLLLDSARTSHDHSLQGSGSVWTCVNDMLSWCAFLAKASQKREWKEEDVPQAIFPVTSMHEKTLTEDKLLRAAWVIQQPEFVFSEAQNKRQSYGMGLYNIKLPTRFINSISNKDSVVMEKYAMGANSFPRKVIGNTSDLGTYTSTYWVFPESESAVIVLSNGNSVNGDATNIIAQCLTQALFNLQPQIDYIAVAKHVSTEALAQWRNAKEQWALHRRPIARAQPLIAYAGTYTCHELQMTLIVTISTATQRARGDTGRIQGDDIGRMSMCINGLPEQVFDLYHYHGDNWTFMPSSRDECVRQGYAQYIQSWKSFIIKFDCFNEDVVRFEGVRWFLDPDDRVKAFQFQKIVEVEREGSPSSVYSQPAYADDEGLPRRSSATLVDYAGRASGRTSYSDGEGRESYSNYIQ